MKYEIKKYKGNWLVSDNNGGWVGFPTHDEAVKYAYDNGASEVNIHYTPRLARAFTREGIENLILKEANNG